MGSIIYGMETRELGFVIWFGLTMALVLSHPATAGEDSASNKDRPSAVAIFGGRPYPVKAGKMRMFLLCSRRRCRLSASTGACGGLCDARDVGVSRTLRIGGGLH